MAASAVRRVIQAEENDGLSDKNRIRKAAFCRGRTAAVRRGGGSSSRKTGFRRRIRDFVLKKRDFVRLCCYLSKIVV